MSDEDLALTVAQSPFIMDRIRSSYPLTANSLDVNREATLNMLQAKGALQIAQINKHFSVLHTGYDDGVKVWTDYSREIELYVDNIIMKTVPKYRGVLHEARNKLANYIHQEYFNRFPRWPAVGVTQSDYIELLTKDHYTYGANDIVWSCEGIIKVEDKRPNASTFQCYFYGTPDIKVLLLDNDKCKQVERMLQNGELKIGIL
ncbi:uncharacterized protein LOC128959681 [Oppia nitens]|uniref:uncharacterized protein LOC128959681 n=1 Tax=Oppia nitens TaxID=1686743 RepID=UPI0023DA388E|nr:uncharacterized protein LOC128959681 [Oppia nitens]